MALLDVIEAISDPMLTDMITVYRMAQTVGSNGRTTSNQTATSIYAIVQAGEGRNVNVFDGGQQVQESMNVFSTFVFIAEAEGVTGDEVEWRGRRWRVTRVVDYSNYGSGYTQAVCLLKTTTQ